MVSVIITTFNRRSFLRNAAVSVLNQEYEDKEIIVVDDGSTDGSQQELTGLPVRYVWKENGGISSARNRGIAEARGDFVAFLDVDDLWKKKKLSVQMGLMKQMGYDISYTDEIWLRGGKHLNQKLRHRKYSGHIFEKCLPLCIISPSSVVMRRNVFNDAGFFDESMPVCEDYDMWLRLTARFPVLFINKPLIVKQGGHEDQLSRRYSGMDAYRIAGIAKILDSGLLKESMRDAAVGELTKKCRIYINGAMKRGRNEEAQYYLKLVERYTAGISSETNPAVF